MSAGVLAAGLSRWARAVPWLAVPGITFLLAFFALPVAGLLLSLQDPRTHAASLELYARLLGQAVYLRVLEGTLLLVRQSTIASLIIAQVETMLQWNFASALAMLLIAATALCCAGFVALFGMGVLTGQPAAAAERGRGLAGRAWLAGLDAVAAALDRLGGAPGLARGARWLLPGFCWIVLGFMSLPALSVIPVAFTSARFISFPPPGYGLHFEELTVAIFVSGGLRTTLPKQLWDDTLHQVRPTVAAASVAVMGVVTALFLPAQRLRPASAAVQAH